MYALSDSELDDLRQKYASVVTPSGFKIINGYTMPIVYESVRETIENLEVYDDDIWITSFPKCGTTWMQELVWCMKNNLDFEGAKEDLDNRYSFIELSGISEVDPDWDELKKVQEMNRPRFIKTHLPWELLPKKIRTGEAKPRIVHVSRNPLDACVSLYHHSIHFDGYREDFNLFKTLFVRNKLTWTPYSSCVLSYWKQRHLSNVCFVKYEDMKADLKSEIEKLAGFLNVELDDTQIHALMNHTSFERMKNNPAVNHLALIKNLINNSSVIEENAQFIRKGKVGGYKEVMNDEDINVIDKNILSFLRAEGLTFDIAIKH